MMHDLYFENVASIGNLYLDYVMFSFENEPIVFICSDDKYNPYLCLCSEIRIEQKWIITKCSTTILKRLETKEIDLRSALRANDTVMVITVSTNSKEKSKVLKLCELDDLDFPEPDVFLDCNIVDIDALYSKDGLAP